MWAAYISPFKNITLPQLGFITGILPHTLVSLNNYTFKHLPSWMGFYPCSSGSILAPREHLVSSELSC